jgi:hypothetical protein
MCDDYVGFEVFSYCFAVQKKSQYAFTSHQIDQGDKLHLGESLHDSFGYSTALESITESAVRVTKRRVTHGKQGARLDQTSGDRGAALQQHKVNCAHLTMHVIGNINIDKTYLHLFFTD